MLPSSQPTIREKRIFQMTSHVVERIYVRWYCDVGRIAFKDP